MQFNNIRLFFLFFFIQCCCNLSYSQNESSKLHLLTNDSVKYWSDAWKIPYFNPYIEGGIAFYRNGDFHQYQYNYENKRIIVDNLSDDVICNPYLFIFMKDTLQLKICGWIHVFKILKLTDDTLHIKELTNYQYYPDSVQLVFIRSRNQNIPLQNGSLIEPDTSKWIIKCKQIK